MRKVLLLGLALALVSGAAYANFCARDYVPAATLLVPYAVVDLAPDGTPNPNGYTTLLAVTNVSSAKQLIHVTVWDACSEHVVDFDEVLTGYDVWTINFRDLLNGRFDYFDTSKSSFSPAPPPPVPFGPTTNVPYTTAWNTPALQGSSPPSNTGCNFPYGNLSSYGPLIVSGLRACISAVPLQQPCTGPDFGSLPYLANLTSNPVFFYVTVDVVRACNQNFPDDPGYWNAVAGKFPIDNNVIIGDVIYLNQFSNFSESIPAVSIEGDLDWATATDLGNSNTYASFYGRYQPPTYYDSHEPLPTAFAFRYMNSGGVNTNLRVWKNATEFATDGDVLACHPYIYYAFDENENSKTRGGGGPSGFQVAEPNNLPFETQSVPMTTVNWSGIFGTNGWMALIFDPSIPNMTIPSTYQAWAGVQYTFAGYSTALEAATLGSYWCFPTGTGTPAAGPDILPALNTYYGAADTYLKK